jgi:hypothetical protein
MSEGFNATLTSGSVCAYLVDTEEISFSANQKFVTDLSGVGAGGFSSNPVGASGLVAKSDNITGITVASGRFSCDTVTWRAVTGDQCEAILFVTDRPSGQKSRLVCYLDTNQTGLPVTPNGGDITFTPSSVGVFEL